MKKISFVFALLFVISAAVCTLALNYNKLAPRISKLMKKNNGYFSQTYPEQIEQASALLTDERSKEVFDASVKMYNLFGKEGYNEELLTSLIEKKKFKPPVLAETDMYLNPAITRQADETALDVSTPSDSELKIELIQPAPTENVEAPKTEPAAVPAAEDIAAPALKIDDFVKEHQLAKLDFIKVDVQDTEMTVLKGAEETLRQFKLALAINITCNPQDLFEFMLYLNSLELGYQFWLDAHGDFYAGRVLYAKVVE